MGVRTTTKYKREWRMEIMAPIDGQLIYQSFVFDACRKKGCHIIGATKTNSILYPEEKRIPATASLYHGCFLPVTVKGCTYMVYRYWGSLNKIDHAVVLLSYPADAIGRKNALRVFIWI